MRDIIDIVGKLLLNEADVVDLKQHRTNKVVGDYAGAIGGIIQGEKNFYATGKFMPFAQSFIESDFNSEYRPTITMRVYFRDPTLSPDARALRDTLRKKGFKYHPATKWVKGSYPGNPNQQAHGPFLEKDIDLNTAKLLFAERNSSPFGAYQPSRLGMGHDSQNIWDDRGAGFNIFVGGMDARRGDKYGNAHREEHHVIDDDKDMKEVADTFAAIQRSHVRAV